MALLAALVIVACVGRPEPPDRTTGSEGQPNTPEDSSVTAGSTDSLRFDIEVPPAARMGEPVPITLRVRNLGKKPLELHLAGRPTAFDISVTGRTVPWCGAAWKARRYPASSASRCWLPAGCWSSRTPGTSMPGVASKRVQGFTPWWERS
jgi:hypothetical protein